MSKKKYRLIIRLDFKPSHHHILPRSKGGDNQQKNLVVVPAYKHKFWHLLFGNKTPQEILEELKSVWLRGVL